MNKKITSASHLKLSAFILLSAITLTACFDNSSEVDIALSDVPKNVVNIVQNALPGITLTEAEKQVADDAIIYELEGQLINGKEYKMKIAEDGTIIKIKLED
jgi:D-arabinose 5-phosphate isomerase GutQ